jgi:head-tail adaptor
MLEPAELNRVLVVWRKSTVEDGQGGREIAWAQVGTVRARTPQTTAVERKTASQLGAEHDSVIYLWPDADVRRGDELRAADTVWRVVSTVRPSETEYLRANCVTEESESE